MNNSFLRRTDTRKKGYLSETIGSDCGYKDLISFFTPITYSSYSLPINMDVSEIKALREQLAQDNLQKILNVSSLTFE